MVPLIFIIFITVDVFMLKKIMTFILIYLLAFNTFGNEFSLKKRMSFIKNKLQKITKNLSENNTQALEFIEQEMKKIEALDSPYNQNFTEKELNKIKDYLRGLKSTFIKSTKEDSSLFQKFLGWLSDAAPYFILAGLVIISVLLIKSPALATDKHEPILKMKESDTDENPINIKLKKAMAQSISWHPNGSYIAYEDIGYSIKIRSQYGSNSGRLGTHNDYIHKIAWNPNGQFIASGSADGVVKIWALSFTGSGLFKGGNLLTSFGGSRKKITTSRSPSWSPDGKYLALIYDKNIVIFCMQTRTFIHSIRTNTKNSISAVAWSKNWYTNSYHIAAVNGFDKTISIWKLSIKNNIFSNTLITTQKEKNIINPRMAWDPNGNYLAYTCANEKDLKIWDLKAKKRNSIITLKGHKNPIHSIAWSFDGKYIAAGASKRVRIWNFRTKKIQPLILDNYPEKYKFKYFPEYKNVITALAWAPIDNHYYLVTGSADQSLQFYDFIEE